MSHESIIQLMIDKGYSDLVGGGDPRDNGELNLAILNKYYSLNEISSVLDYGCGCGRLALPLLEQMQGAGKYVGIDIIPDLIDFCISEISTIYSNSQFIRVDAQNSHYSKWLNNIRSNDYNLAHLAETECQSYSLITAFSVFTHMPKREMALNLNLLSNLLQPNGKIILSMFLINSFTHSCIESGISMISFNRNSFKLNQHIFYADQKDPMAAVGVTEDFLFDIASESGLTVTDIHYGRWRGRPSELSFQDVVVLGKAAHLPDNFNAKRYLDMNSDLPWSPESPSGLLDAKLHYLHHGYYEGRRSK